MKACKERNSTFLLQGMQHPERHRKEHSNRVHPKATLKEPLKVSLTACILLFALSHMVNTGYCYTHAVEPHRQQQRHRSELDRCRHHGIPKRDTRAKVPPTVTNEGVAKYYTLEKKKPYSSLQTKTAAYSPDCREGVPLQFYIQRSRGEP